MAPSGEEHLVWAEIERLRNWRHDEAVPALASLRGRLQALEVSVQELKPEVERMAKAQEIAEAVTADMRKRRGSLFTRTEKVVGVCVGIASVVSITLQLLWH